MKKIVLFVFVILLSMITVGCNFNNNNNDKEKTKEEIVNALLDKDYSNIDITSITSKDDYSLTSTYKINNTNGVITLTYSIEKYNKLDINNPDTEEKTTQTGKIEYQNGERRVIEGDNVNIDINGLSLKGLKFSESDFDSVEFSNGKVVLKSSNGKRFLNESNDLLNFEIVIEYSDEAINKVTISYKQDSYNVLTTYQVK